MPTPLKLPLAPDKYDRRDQDHTRRLIELAFGQYGFNIQALAGVRGPQDQDFVPVSPVHGCVAALGDAVGAGHSACIQLLNPLNSGKLVIVYDLRIDYDSALTPAGQRLQLTDSPATLTVQNTATLFHLNDADVSVISTTLKGGVASPEFQLPSQWAFNLSALTSGDPRVQMRSVISPGEMPAILIPGQAIEYENARETSDSFEVMYAVFDEVPVNTALGVAVSGFTGPRSSCVGSMLFGGTTVSVSGALELLQLYNPGPTLLKLTGLYVLADHTNPTAVRRTASPLALGGTVISAPLRRLDRRSSTAINAQLKLSTNAGSALFSNSFWQETKVGTADNRLPWHARVIKPFAHPVYVKPGSAIEVGCMASISAQNGVTAAALFLFDEV
jgi:hypothetical protein